MIRSFNVDERTFRSQQYSSQSYFNLKRKDEEPKPIEILKRQEAQFRSSCTNSVVEEKSSHYSLCQNCNASFCIDGQYCDAHDHYCECGRLLCQTCSDLQIVDCDSCRLSCCDVCYCLKTCEVCRGRYCEFCSKVEKCKDCSFIFCSRCQRMGYCEACDSEFCEDCRYIESCDSCNIAMCHECGTISECPNCMTNICPNCQESVPINSLSCFFCFLNSGHETIPYCGEFCVDCGQRWCCLHTFSREEFEISVDWTDDLKITLKSGWFFPSHVCPEPVSGPKRLALLMGTHPRLGAESAFADYSAFDLKFALRSIFQFAGILEIEDARTL